MHCRIEAPSPGSGLRLFPGPLGSGEFKLKSGRNATVESRSGAVTPKCPVSRSRSSNRACRSPAPGFRTRYLACAHDGPASLEARQPDDSKLAIQVLVGKTILDLPLDLVLSS